MSLEISHVMESQLWPGKALKLMWGKQFLGEPHSDVGDLALPWEPPSLMETHTLPWGIEALKKQKATLSLTPLGLDPVFWCGGKPSLGGWSPAPM